MMQCPNCGTRRLYVTETRRRELVIICDAHIPTYHEDATLKMTAELGERVSCSYCGEVFHRAIGKHAWKQAQAKTPAPNPYY